MREMNVALQNQTMNYTPVSFLSAFGCWFVFGK